MSRKILMGKDYEPICLKTQEIIMLNEITYGNFIFFLFLFITLFLALMIKIIKQEIYYEQFYYNRDTNNTKVTVHSMV
jgi:hypothetical protein